MLQSPNINCRLNVERKKAGIEDRQIYDHLMTACQINKLMSRNKKSPWVIIPVTIETNVFLSERKERVKACIKQALGDHEFVLAEML